MNRITESEETRARDTSEVNLNLSEEQKVNFDPVLDGFTNDDAFMLKNQKEPRVEQSDEPDPHFISFIATDIEIKANGIKGDYQNCSGD